jgi:hypothetical protein
MRPTYRPTLDAAIATARHRGYSDGRYGKPSNPDTICLLGPAVLAAYREGWSQGKATVLQPSAATAANG